MPLSGGLPPLPHLPNLNITLPPGAGGLQHAGIVLFSWVSCMFLIVHKSHESTKTNNDLT